MRIGILGSGLMGGTLGTILARAGHDVMFSYAHTREKLERLAHDAGSRARAGTPAEAVAKADAVVLAVHWSRLDDVLGQAGRLSGKTVISCTLPMSRDDSRLVVGLSTSAAETLAKRMPRARIVSAFSTAPSEVLLPVYARRRRRTRPDLVYCGNHRGAKRTAAVLIRDAGFTPVDLGELSMARHVEPFSLLLAQIAYEGRGGPELVYRFERVPRPR